MLIQEMQLKEIWSMSKTWPPFTNLGILNCHPCFISHEFSFIQYEDGNK